MIIKPHIYILATGGTIAGAGKTRTQYAGYTAATDSIDKILETMPELNDLAKINSEQFLQVASHDISLEQLLSLAKRTNAILSMPDIDGIIITHGTNTLEETAYFLNLVVKSKKPIVLTGAMRPASSISADGSMNLFQAVATATSVDAIAKGVLIVMNGNIYAARDVQKTDTSNVDAFQSPLFGCLGFVLDNKPYFYKSACRKHTFNSEFNIAEMHLLSQVVIINGYIGDDSALLDAAININVKGIVFAGAGTASVSKKMLSSIQNAISKKIMIVRTPRSASGMIYRNMEFDDDKYRTIAGDTLTPAKARILLMLSLEKADSPEGIQYFFDNY